MAFNLLAAARKKGKRRRIIKFRVISPRPAHVQGLRSIYAAALDVWNRAEDAILAQYGQDARRFADVILMDSPEDVRRLLDLAVFETERAMVRIIGSLRDWARSYERYHRQEFTKAVLAATSVDLSTILTEHDVNETVEAVVARNVELIRDISTQARGRIAEIVFRGFQNRTPAREVGKQIAEAVDMGRTRANNIAADQTTKLSASLDEARQEDAGIHHFIWRHSRKMHARQEHVARNGVLYKWKAGGPGPGREPPSDKPGQLPYCGCQAQAALVDSGGNVL